MNQEGTARTTTAQMQIARMQEKIDRLTEDILKRLGNLGKK